MHWQFCTFICWWKASESLICETVAEVCIPWLFFGKARKIVMAIYVIKRIICQFLALNKKKENLSGLHPDTIFPFILKNSGKNTNAALCRLGNFQRPFLSLASPHKHIITLKKNQSQHDVPYSNVKCSECSCYQNQISNNREILV